MIQNMLRRYHVCIQERFEEAEIILLLENRKDKLEEATGVLISITLEIEGKGACNSGKDYERKKEAKSVYVHVYHGCSVPYAYFHQYTQ